MAEQDFAQIEAPAAPRGQWQGFAVAFLGVALVAGAFAAGFMLGKERGQQIAVGEEKRKLLEQIKKQQKENERLKKELARARAARGIEHAAPFGEDQLLFFEDLPNEPVQPPPLPEPAPAQPATQEKDEIGALIAEAQRRTPSKQPALTDERWAVQLAAFRSQQDAQRLQRRLNEAEVRTWIEEATVDGTLWHRVYAGPYSTREDAEQARHTLHQRFGLRGLVKRMERKP